MLLSPLPLRPNWLDPPDSSPGSSQSALTTGGISFTGGAAPGSFTLTIPLANHSPVLSSAEVDDIILGYLGVKHLIQPNFTGGRERVLANE
jgi:hypothetical protein